MPRTLYGLATGLAMAMAAGAAGAQHRTRPDDTARIDAILEEQQQREHIPGLAFVAVKEGRVAVLRALGQRDRERKLPVTADTLFPIGSCTKSFTAMAVAAAADDRRLSLDDPPHRFLPYFKMADPEANAKVTLRDMLSHQTGLKGYADLAAEPGVLTREQYIRAAVSARPVAPFRTRFQYSNAMYSAAGEVLAKVHGMPWEAVIERTLFRPLGMSRSVASLGSLRASADHAVGYVYQAGANDWKAVPPPASLAALAPAGAIASTANDMARWLLFLTARGAIDGRRLVSDGSFREVTRPHIALNDTLSYGLGWAVYRWNGLTVVEHTGGSLGISAVVSFIPERRVGFAFLANTSPNFMTRVGNAGRLFWPLLLEGTPPDSAPAPSTMVTAAPSPVPIPSPAASLPAAEEVIARMVAAHGGEQVLRRHRSMELRGTRTYENHGVEADLVVLAEEPDRRTEEESWTAAGTRIGQVRVFFDGTRGGQETSFGQDSTFEGEENERVRRKSFLHPILGLARVYKGVALRRMGTVGGEETYVLDLVTASGAAAAWHVSVATGRLIQTEADGETTTYGDYRDVDGELVAFRTTTQEPLGEITVVAKRVRFNVDLPPGAFAPLHR